MTIEEDIVELANHCVSLLPDQELERIRDVAEAGEWGVALETLITQLVEYDANLSSDLAKRLAESAKAAGLGQRYFDLLSNLAAR